MAAYWKRSAVTFQEEMYEHYADEDWNNYNENELHQLKDKIKMLLFGLSPANNKEAERIVAQITRVIIKENVSEYTNRTKVAFVFVVGTLDGENIESWPVFRVPKDQRGSKASFIDANCRVYESWRLFLENNKIPPCEYCYPRDGKYEYICDRKTAIEFGQSPESKTSRKVQKTLNAVSTGVAIGASVLTVASFVVPVAAPLLAASAWASVGTSSYSTIRSSSELYDRKKHKQDISLYDGEARKCYCSLAFNVLGFGYNWMRVGKKCATVSKVGLAQKGVLGTKVAPAIKAMKREM